VFTFLLGWFGGCSPFCLVGWLVQHFAWLVGVGWLIGWLVDWLGGGWVVG
jgi:hypothetical protein